MSLVNRRKITPAVDVDSIFNHKPVIECIFSHTDKLSDIINIGLLNKRCQSVFKTKKQQLNIKKRVEIERFNRKVQQRYEWAVEFVKEQTPEICMAAVKQDGWALQHVKEQTS